MSYYWKKNDWKFEGSTAGDAGGGRTHTFGVKKPAARLAGSAAYLLPGIELKGGKPVLMDDLEQDFVPPNKVTKKISPKS